jgi:hypothetical protein
MFNSWSSFQLVSWNPNYFIPENTNLNVVPESRNYYSLYSVVNSLKQSICISNFEFILLFLYLFAESIFLIEKLRSVPKSIIQKLWMTFRSAFDMKQAFFTFLDPISIKIKSIGIFHKKIFLIDMFDFKNLIWFLSFCDLNQTVPFDFFIIFASTSTHRFF